MKDRNYKLQNTNYKQITNYKSQITNKDAHKLHELTRIAERNYNGKITTKGSHGLHRDTFKLQSMTVLIKGFCGGPGGGFFKKGGGTPNLFTVSQMSFFRGVISKVCRRNKVSQGISKKSPLAAGGKREEETNVVLH
ncbi:MAG: hypothetical protein PVH61_30635 [Candidatus Aminicenantes bacterium]|jgi:hypothetical protein